MNWILGAFCTFTITLSSLNACTGILLKAADGKAVHGRTLEFGEIVESYITVIPRNHSFTGKTSNGEGLKYTSKYGSIGVSCFEDIALMDGMNEKGLSVGTFYFPGFAEYTEIKSDNQNIALSPVDLPNWILTQFSTLEEVKAGLKNIVVAPTVIKGWGDAAPPFHYIVIEKSGNSMVIEPIGGTLVVRDNPLGVFTNSPTFDWHMTNLRNFINLTPINAKPIETHGITLAPFGMGSGMVGIPGDFTPPSRFVRAAIYSIVATPSKDSQEAIFQTFHILNQFDIPVGTVSQKSADGVVHSDFTQATVARDPNMNRYYLRTYDDQNIKMVDLNAFDLDAKEVKRVSTAGKQTYEDVSKSLQPI